MKLTSKTKRYPHLWGVLKEKFFSFKHDRHVFTKGERISFLATHQKCNYCGKQLTVSRMEIDHTVRLHDGGDNSDANLQALCVECHFEKTNDEQTTMVQSKTHSPFNGEMRAIVESPLSQSLAFVECTNNTEREYRRQKNRKALDFGLDDDSDDENIDYREGNVISVDINKCRANEMLYNIYNYPLFTVMDSVQEYTGQRGPGYYYVETVYFPMHGNGWYQYPMIDFCLSNNIITSDNIKYCCIASCTIPHDYFNNFIHYCREKLGDYGKLAINSMIGSFAMNMENSLWQCSKITENVNEAFDFFISDHSTFVDSNVSDRGKYYSVFKEISSTTLETEKPIYNMILELEAIELYKLSKEIESKGGKVLDLKTDCIRCSFDGDIPFTSNDGKNLDGYYFDDDCLVPKFKFETPTALNTDRKPRWLRNEQFHLQRKEWKHYQDIEGNDFTPLVHQMLDEMGSCNLQASAGCGKTTLIENYLKPELERRKLTYTVLTPTNISALLVNGSTLDKFTAKIKTKETLEKHTTNYFIIDECSMMKEVNYKLLSVIKNYHPNTNFIITGDFKQHKPVKDRVGDQKQSYYQDSHVLHELCKGNRLTLTTCRRSDDKLSKLCEHIADLTTDQFNNKVEKHHICFTNDKRKEINQHMMESVYKARKMGRGLQLSKLHYDKNSQDVELFSGMPVMSSKNIPVIKLENEQLKLDVFNNEMFTIAKIDNNYVHIKNSRVVEQVPIKSFQRCFYVAYAITSHKAQGQTYNHPFTIHEWTKMSTRCKRVALTRATKWEYVNII